jgi:hypothetical protein
MAAAAAKTATAAKQPGWILVGFAREDRVPVPVLRQ